MSLIKQFHEKKLQELIKRYSEALPEKAKFYKSCRSQEEFDLLLKGDSDFLKVLNKRLKARNPTCEKYQEDYPSP